MYLTVLTINYLQTIREQYPEEAYDHKMQPVKFSSDSDPAIGIRFQKELGGWLFVLQGNSDRKVSNGLILISTL